MPHATGDDAMDGGDESSAISGFLREYGGDGYGFGGDDSAPQRAFDQTDKADDAEDYEDISDDDLPDEEEATHRTNDDQDNPDDEFARLQNALGGLPVQPSLPRTNGYHVDQDAKEQHSSDLFGEADDPHDLFGDHSSSPEQHRAVPPNHAQPPLQRPGGLALPSKSSLALPSLTTDHQRLYQPPFQQHAESMSPASSFHGDGYSPATSYDSDVTDEAGMTKDELEQRKLFKQSKKRQAGEDVDDPLENVDLDFFYSVFPRFETNQAPNFADLFPPRPVTYRGKVPFKPPRPVQPTKLSLDLLPDQEKSFRTPGLVNKGVEEHLRRDGLVFFSRGVGEQDGIEDDLAWSIVDENERIGGVTMDDLAIICGDWDVPSSVGDAPSIVSGDPMDGDWELEELARPRKFRRTGLLDKDFSLSIQDPQLPFEEPERATARLAKSVALDLNDPNLLIDELSPQRRRRTSRATSSKQREGALSKDGAKRYNISNDKEYDKLKENHQHKVRSTLGSMAVEHSLPATKLQYPFYKVNLDPKQKRAFHRPHLEIRDSRRELRFSKLKHIKRKHLRGREVKDLFAKAEDLYLGDNANVMLLEYSEEAPIMLSNFGMGNRLINYYRKRDTDDQERPKREVGETHVLLTQDKSPFANFGHVDRGEVVPTVQNGMYRAPVFSHKSESTDFLVGVSSTYGGGYRFYLRNVENLHTVGQQFPVAEVPGQHSRKVTDAAKKRLRALSYRMYTKSHDPNRPISKRKPLNNENLMPHLPGHDMPQTRSKMREFMKYERAPGKDSGGVWVPMPGQVVPDSDTLRSWIRPEDVCLLDSMQVGVQHLADLGIKDEKGGGDDEKELDDGANIELQLAPWRTTKNFLNACQGKAMLALHGEGDPTGVGEGFSFVKTSMKGGFQALGQSADDKIEAKKRQQAGGHMYNVAKQQKLYDDDIRWIWDKQKQRLGADVELSDTEMEDAEEPQGTYQYTRGATPRSSMGTPAAFARHDDDSASQFSKGSVERGEKVMTITRRTMDKWGKAAVTYEKVTNPRVIALYKRKRMEKQLNDTSIHDMLPTGDEDLDALKRQKLERELARVERNFDRREAREKTKGRVAGSPGAADSPGQSDANNSVEGTPQKGRGRNKDGTARKCANCGQVGHIKTNRKSVSFRCPMCAFESKEPLKQVGVGYGGSDSAERTEVRNALSSSYSKFSL